MTTQADLVYDAVHEEIMKLRVKLHDVLNGRSDIDSIVYHAQNAACGAAVRALKAGSGTVPASAKLVDDRAGAQRNEADSQDWDNLSNAIEQAQTTPRLRWELSPVNAERVQEEFDQRIDAELSTLNSLNPLMKSILRDILAELTPRPKEGWQPMETAPKDDDLILLYLDGSGVRPGYWDVDSRWDEKLQQYVDGAGRWLAVESQSLTGGGWHAEPTHWMPLPLAPKEGK